MVPVVLEECELWRWSRAKIPFCFEHQQRTLKELWLLVFCKSFPSDAFTPDQSKPSLLLRQDKNTEHGRLFFFLQHLLVETRVTSTRCCCNPSRSNRRRQKLRTVALNVYHFKPLLGKFYHLIMSLCLFSLLVCSSDILLYYFCFWTPCTRVCWCVCDEFHRDTLIKTTAAKSLHRVGCAPALRGAFGACVCVRARALIANHRRAFLLSLTCCSSAAKKKNIYKKKKNPD